MRLYSSLCLSLALAVSAGAASAQTITLNSFGQSNANPGYTAPATGALTNTVTTFAGGATYDIPTGGTWATPLGSSSWVSQDPENYPGGSTAEPGGTYTFATTFYNPGTVTGGSLSLLADDTSSVYLNNNLILAAADPNAAAHCTQGLPNCETATTLDLGNYLSDFVAGANTLTFAVNQDFGYAEGVDFSGSVNTVTPEPNSLLLLSTGFLAMAGVFSYRKRQAQQA